MTPSIVPAAARRPVSLLMLGATVLGLWFGLRAPDVSPVAPAGVGQAVPASVSGAVGPARDGAGEVDRGRRGGRP